MEELFVRPSARQRMHEGPLGPHIDAFIRKLAETGYARASQRRAVWLVGDFSRWLQQRGVADRHLTTAHVDAFLRSRKRRRTPRFEDRPTLTRLMSHLAHCGVIVVATVGQTLTPVQELEVKYVKYLRHERNLAPMTVHANRFEARRLMASPARSRRSDWRTSTGARQSCGFAMVRPDSINCRCRTMLAMPWPSTCARGAHFARPVWSSSDRRRRARGFRVARPSPASCAARCAVLTSTHHARVHMRCGTRWRPCCCAKGHHWPRSARCFAIAGSERR